MRLVSGLTVSAVFVALSIVGAAFAQLQTPSGVSTHANNLLPAGSYQNSCTDISMVGGKLTAHCLVNDGGSAYMFDPDGLEAAHCAPGADIRNWQGYLQCPPRPGVMGPGRVMPSGSYMDTCMPSVTRVTIKHNVPYLDGACRGNSGVFRLNRIDLRRCDVTGDITAPDGFLTCTPRQSRYLHFGL